MSNREPASDDQTRRDTRSGNPSGLESALGMDPGATDLGDDVNRTETNRGGSVGSTPSAATEGNLDPRNNDLGDDVYRER